MANIPEPSSGKYQAELPGPPLFLERKSFFEVILSCCPKSLSNSKLLHCSILNLLVHVLYLPSHGQGKVVFLRGCVPTVPRDGARNSISVAGEVMYFFFFLCFLRGTTTHLYQKAWENVSGIFLAVARVRGYKETLQVDYALDSVYSDLTRPIYLTIMAEFHFDPHLSS